MHGSASTEDEVALDVKLVVDIEANTFEETSPCVSFDFQNILKCGFAETSN